ncbi:MAG: NAD(P)/FAD-dependent oxidoreductase [Syntrophaceae bacterium]|nr:NAD(P)/FAD-dependent oxidoreductase [Syntrophaceae bacterium]
MKRQKEQELPPEDRRVVVVGAGAAGMMAAGRAAECGVPVLLLEKTDRPGRKIQVTGKGRCNLSNTKDLGDFLAMFGPNGSFLHGVFRRFFREELLELLQRHGLTTKVERGGRIFPASDQAADVLEAFRRYLIAGGAPVRIRTRVVGLNVREGRMAGVETAEGFIPARAVILATGGSTWPATGSTGDGYSLAESTGHTIVPLRPSLVPLVVEELDIARSMQGVSLRNVRLTAYACRSEEIREDRDPVRDVGRGIPGKRPAGRVIESRMGEMMLTHFGIGGPVTLLMSLAVVDALKRGPVSVSIDFKPALTREQLRDRLQRDLDSHGKRTAARILEGLLPQKATGAFLRRWAIEPDKRANQVSAVEREALLGLLKSFRFNIRTPLPMASAIVTAGGVSLKEVDPRTMASRLVEGLFFCGEILDLDADTGGYNLQAAFSTGYVAGESAAKTVSD